MSTKKRRFLELKKNLDKKVGLSVANMIHNIHYTYS